MVCHQKPKSQDVQAKGCYEALQRLGYKNAELIEVDTNITEKLKEGKYDYAYNALHGKFGEDGCIQRNFGNFTNSLTQAAALWHLLFA